MTTLTIPTEEYGSECYACSVGAGSERCECYDENRCYGCNEKIAWQYDVTVDGEHYHRTCAEQEKRMSEKWNTDEKFDYDLCFTEGGEAMSAFQVFDESNWPVAAIWVDNHFSPLPVAKERARLIAAAPELVAALEELEGWLDKDHSAAVRARALLARIKGESNE